MRYNGPPGNGDDIARIIKLDNFLNVYVTGKSDNGGLQYDMVTIKYSQLIGIKQISGNVPGKFYLNNYPNPFNPVTKINYQLPKNAVVKLIIYDIVGREVIKLVNNEFKEAGYYTVEFNGQNFASGVYFYRIEAGDFVQSKKMVLVK